MGVSMSNFKEYFYHNFGPKDKIQWIVVVTSKHPNMYEVLLYGTNYHDCKYSETIPKFPAPYIAGCTKLSKEEMEVQIALGTAPDVFKLGYWVDPNVNRLVEVWQRVTLHT